MVVVCDYSREERHCCRPIHSYRFVIGNMLILVGIISEERSLSDKFIIGRATVGIIARVCTYLSAHQVNVLDISQTIIDGFFNMMMIVDYSNADEEFGTVVDDLDKLGEEIGVRIRCQREEIFTKMHRV